VRVAIPSITNQYIVDRERLAGRTGIRQLEFVNGSAGRVRLARRHEQSFKSPCGVP
jgi:hypothetical protein